MKSMANLSRESQRMHDILGMKRDFSSSSLRDYRDDVAIVGAAWDLGQKHHGADDGPSFLRQGGGFVQSLTELGYEVHDDGDIRTSKLEGDDMCNNVRYPRTCGKAFKQISDKVDEAIRSGAMCLTLGGDHSIAIGTISGHAQSKKDMCVIWVDAHADINPPQASESGNIHGMPLAFLVHELSQYIPPIPGMEWVKPCVNAKNLAYIGLRDVDIAEKSIIKTLGIPSYTMHDIDRNGIVTCVEDALQSVNPDGDKSIHLSFDIDACDVALAPSTGTPVSGGLTVREAMYIVERVAATGCLTAMDMVEVNPALGTAIEKQTTLQSATDIILACLGKRCISRLPEGYTLPMPNLS